MDYVKLEATKRITKGKGSSRRLRIEGNVPAVVYGKGIESSTVTVEPMVLKKALAGPLRINTPLNLVITDKDSKKSTEILSIVRDHQYDPVTRELLHVDFLAINDDTMLEMTVPVVKEGRSLGEQDGGVVRWAHRTVSISCTPAFIPENIVVDITNLKKGTSLHTSEVETPEGVKINLPGSEAIISIAIPAAEEEEEETEETEAGAAPAEAETETPAAE